MVVVIIGILLSIAIPSFNRYQQRVQLIDAHVKLKNALEEAFSGSRSEPLFFVVQISKDPASHSEFSIEKRDSLGAIIPGSEQTIPFDAGVYVKEILVTQMISGSLSDSPTDSVEIIFQPPYGDVSFLDGGFALDQQAYFIQLENPAPLNSYFRIWNSSLIEHGIE